MDEKIKLTVLGLPIGNIMDMSMRGVETLKNASLIVCEDTRVFNSLWMKMISLGWVEKFSGRLLFMNDFNEERVIERVMMQITENGSAVLVSDAGMPLISDPGFKLVREGLARNWEIEVVPGPTAEAAALAVSGLPTDKYLFLGFLAKKSGKRKQVLEMALREMEIVKTIVIYESPQRIVKILPEIKEVMGEVNVCIAKDLTKQTEKVWRGSIDEIMSEMKKVTLKGEIVLVVSKS